MFDYVYLEDSFVLRWNFKSESQQLVFHLEASLWKGHEYYTEPLPDEFTCYKSALLVFENVRRVDGLLSMDEIKPSVDIDGTVDYENIEGFCQPENDIYKFSGDFGDVTIACKNARLEFNSI